LIGLRNCDNGQIQSLATVVKILLGGRRTDR